MRFSHLFTATRRDAPKDEVAKNAQLLVRAGFIHKEMAGVYSYLPLGFRVLKKIENIIREEMDAIGGQEVLLTALQDPDVWKKSGRWSDDVVDNWFKTTLANGAEAGIANTHEEPLTALMREHVRSYRDLPRYVYQIQDKFRNELRAKSGLMRGREFIMKDLYSFTKDENELERFHEKCAEAYLRIFRRVGLGELTYRTFASGGAFSKYSDEFQTLSEAGEDTIYVDKEKGIAVNKEVYTDEALADLGLKKENLVEAKAIEVGNIFKLGTRFSEALGLTYRDEDGAEKPVVMGSYGIGLGRLMGAAVEVFSDEKGIVWPEEIAPFAYHLIALGAERTVRARADEIYDMFAASGAEALYDDREESAGVKFADAELIGIPTVIIVSEKTLSAGEDRVEVRRRATGASRMARIGDIVT
ncbi:MAG: prolyl-tRNA synthetase [Parcubacteria group bacterium]|nr:prolyl-tRNA synthetase [Parcubacteria group bacterium]